MSKQSSSPFYDPADGGESLPASFSKANSSRAKRSSLNQGQSVLASERQLQQGVALAPNPSQYASQPLVPTRKPKAAGLSQLGLSEPLSLTNEERSMHVVQKRVGLLAGHMAHQYGQHQQALRNTTLIFNQLLDDLTTFCGSFKEAFGTQPVELHRIFSEMDPDRSIGMLNILWHCLSFTTRGNAKPLALFRPDREPVFTGRILAIRGDFHDISHTYETQQFTDLLGFELASLYVPSDPLEPAVMRVPHLGEEEQFLAQPDAARLFLLKTVEMVCGGGFLHEQ
jgi:hypothetical protein